MAPTGGLARLFHEGLTVTRVTRSEGQFPDSASHEVQSSRRMASIAEPQTVIEHLLNAARGSERRFLVGLPNPAERKVIADIVSEEGAVIEATSTTAALARLADESFEIA